MGGSFYQTSAGRATLVILPLAVIAGLFAIVGSKLGDDSSTTAATTSRTATPTTVRVTPTTVRSTTTTIRTTTTMGSTTTTIQPGPVSLLQEYDGIHPRFNPCQKPINIKLNGGGYLNDASLANVESFLSEQASDLSRLTGLSIVYSGQSTYPSSENLHAGEDILIHFGQPGEGVLTVDHADWWYDTYAYWRRSQGGFREVVMYQIQLNVEYVNYDYSAGLSNSDQRVLMHLLGVALGLAPLNDDDMLRADPPGDSDSWSREIMYFSGIWDDIPAEWGAGDVFGLDLVGARNGCFTGSL